MKYFAIRLSLLINFILISMLMCINLDHSEFSSVMYYGAFVAAFTGVNYLIMTKYYTKEERETILLQK